MPDWVKLTPETMPHGECIAISMLRGTPSYKEYLLGYIGFDEESKTGYVCENEHEILYDVTHWMPKLKPPGEEE